ncbi:CPSF A subunit region-domain-containing protein [Amylostereum chailletii]|nr:CPSF A subunit region-domain-containing protein [Amylostereum chailletii]
MLSLHQEILPPSGVEYATTLRLTPSTITHDLSSIPSTSTSPQPIRVLCNVVVARSNHLRIFEVREEPAPFSAQADIERERRSDVRKGTEAVEGEVEMDEQGEGFVNMGSVKSIAFNAPTTPPTVVRFHFVREHRLHGTVTGMESVRIMSSAEDRLDRLLVSFKEAKIALLEWSSEIDDLLTVSIHTYERAPQLLSLEYPFHSELRTDPTSRCAALLLPKDALAILPFYQSQAELDMMDQDQGSRKDIPYSPSFILDLREDVDERIQNVVDFVFLPGFTNPTMAVLFEAQRTWTGRLKEFKDTMKLFIVTLDLVTRNCPVITAVEGLPYDCLSLLPCPPALGGVVILTANAVIHVDQASRRIALPVNGWPSRISDMPMQPPLSGEENRNLQLEGAVLAFVDDRTLFVILRDGLVYPVEFSVDGKIVSRLTIGAALAQTTAPSLVRRVVDEHLFIGSVMGPSILMRMASVEEAIEIGDTTSPSAVVDQTVDPMDLDDDDIYGTSLPTPQPNLVNGIAPKAKAKTKMRTVIHTSMCDYLPAYGPISDLTFSLAKNGERFVPELVAATGFGSLGGFTLFQRDLPIRAKRKLHIIGGARGLWSLPVRQPVKVNGASYDKPANPFQTENDSVIISTDATPSPGFSRVAKRSPTNDINITNRIPSLTVGAAAFFNGTAILHVLSNAIRVLEPDGTERQIIKDMDGNTYRPKIKHCSICDPFVLIIRDDETIGLFIGEPERGKVRRKDMSPMGEKTSRYVAGSFHTDTTGLFRLQTTDDPTSPTAGPQGNTSTLQMAMDAGQKSQWLILCRPQGVMEIWSLPKLALVFSTTAIASLRGLLVDSFDPPALSLPQDPRRKPQDLDIEQIVIAPLGESSPLPHLLVFLRSGQMAIYKTIGAESALPAEHPASRTSFLSIKFVKVLSRAFNIQRPEEQDKSVLAEQRRISRQFIPFVTSPTPNSSFSGVFFTGDRPCWILGTDRAGLKIHPSGHAVVHSFTSCSLWDSKGDFLLYTEEGPTLLEWIPNLQLDTELVSRFVPRSRSYSNVLFDPSSCLIVAASRLQADFSSFDEEDNEVWTPDAPNVSYPKTDCSALELLNPDGWVAMDGFDFAYNEFVTAMDCVSLETQSTDSGRKNYIAVGTTINRGEDLAVKGATYIFEIVEVVPDPASGLSRSFKLRLRCRDEAKGPVTAVCGIDGYLVSSMGQKIFIRAFDLDERLVGVAFLDIGVYVTSIRALKNLLILGDAVKSVWFVAFQEDPYKLVVLAKDPRKVCVTAADFFFVDQSLSILTCDEEGIVRLYEYDPHDPESKNGQALLCRTEFHAQMEYRTSTTVARRAKAPDMSIPQAKLICGSPDGSLTAFIPVDDATHKRLHLLQGQLTRNVQHTAGLNPRAFRTVRNDTVGKSLTRGVLDGMLLDAFGDLSVAKQAELTRQIGTERAVVVRDLVALSGPW